jgi:hypothetical protein
MAQLTQLEAVDLDLLHYELLESLSARPLAPTAIRCRSRTDTFSTSYRRQTMKFVIIAVEVAIGISCTDARAGQRRGDWD